MEIPCSEYHAYFPLLRLFQGICPILRPCVIFFKMLFFYSKEFLVPQPIPKLKNHPLFSAGYHLFNIFVPILHITRLLPPFTKRTCYAVENYVCRVK
jgi:hypothetical protein